MKKITTVELKEEMHFVAEIDGHKIDIDADEQFGGKDNGPRPKGLTLVSLAGCTAMDVISILRKMRTNPEGLRVEVESELTTEHPKVYKEIHLKYYVKGDVPLKKIERAVELSQSTYCGVSAMLKKAVPITHEIIQE